MKNKAVKILSVLICFVLLATMLCSCDIKDMILSNKQKEEPVAVSLATDLNDASLSFTYGELKGNIGADKLGNLFQEFEEKDDSSVIYLSYNDIINRFGSDDEELERVMNLLSSEEKNMLIANSHQVLEYFVSHLNYAKTARPIVKYKESFKVDKDTIKFTQNGNGSDSKIAKATEYFADFATKGLNDSFKEETTKKGADLTNILYLLGSDVATTLTSDDVVSVISSLSKETKTNSDKEKVVTAITRTIEIVVKDSPESVTKAFTPKDKAIVLQEMKKSSSYFTMDDYSVGYKACKITATFNAVTDDILTVSYDNNMVINTQVKGAGSLEYLGVQDLTFNCTDNMYYQFGWDAEAK